MSQDKNSLLALVATNKPDNNIGSITPEKDREVNNQMIASAANLFEGTEQTFIGDVKFTGKGLGYYTELARSQSVVTQTGGAIDTVQPITFGSGVVTSVGNEIRIDPDGTIHILKSGPYFFKQVAQVGRTSSSGNVEAFFQVEVSTDSGVTWSPASATLNLRIQNPNAISAYFDLAPVYLTAGLIFRSVWAQSSVGGDPLDPTAGVADAELVYSQPSAALLALGIQESHSAAVVLYGISDFNYV